jgi:hypothetical protein
MPTLWPAWGSCANLPLCAEPTREKAMKTFVLAAIAMVLIHSAEAHASTRDDLVKILVQIKVKSETGINIRDLMAFQGDLGTEIELCKIQKCAFRYYASASRGDTGIDQNNA